MDKTRVVLIILVGAVVAIVWVAHNKLRMIEMAAKQNWRPVVMAVCDIPSHAQITRGMVDLIPVPPELLVLAVATNTTDVVGKSTTDCGFRRGDQVRLSGPAK